MRRAQRALAWATELFEDDDPAEPGYDPIHLGTAVVVTLAALGCVYWLLWTLLVYEGGLLQKLQALARLAFTSATLAELGYEGPYAMGAFEGWFGNVVALGFTLALVSGLRRLYLQAAARHRKK